ncbi:MULTISPECIES: hypothetical protein [unclassified Sporosarcina]|uniref:hypothetical protein n=1 Tax=unclassified Sporosarcina TaxID=2647733 RepID=UPI00203EA335|nr:MULTISPECIES: hypothetical protein [unclassified Sporosarcina]GKV64393.1 hypothetical protein NCCP2331_05460 [Sporosarcina sp. NCCP-2331]GLB55138.1 hypothetical protein NCCP2378_09240 [Sporosarcina sp. NCCP-2378]
MKKQIISTLGALMLTTGALHGINAEASPNNTSSHKAAVSHYQGGYNNQAAKMDVTKLPEYATIDSNVNASAFNFRVVEDQKVIRKMLLNDAQGRTQYKTIFNKTTKQLKIINTRGGMVYNQVIKEKPAAQAKPVKPAVKPSQPSTDLSSYTARVVSDNYNTRVTVYTDAQNRAQYKTILVKRTGAVKTIRL